MLRVVRPLVVLAAAAIVAATGAGLALQELAGGHHLASDGPAALALSIGLFGALILWLQPRNRLGRLLVGAGLGFAAGVLSAGTLDYGATHAGVPRALEQLAYAGLWSTAALVSAWTLLILWFPDGSFPDRAWRRYFAAATAVSVGIAGSCWLLAPGVSYDFFAGTLVPEGVHGPLATDAWLPVVRWGGLILLFPLGALGSLVQRHRRASPVVRQQIRWLIVPAGASIVVEMVSVPLRSGGGAAWAIGAVLGIVAQFVTVGGVTVAVLRYRLWEIETAVTRALVYGVLWSALTAILLVPALAAGLLVGGSSAFAAVGLALLVTVVFQPARSRLELLAERLVYRRRPRPHVLLTGFWELLRSTVDPAELGPLVADAVRSGLGVRWAGVWLATQGGLRPLGVAGSEPGPAALLPPAAAARLREAPGVVLAGEPPPELAPLWPSPPAAVVPLVAGSQLVGLLACGRGAADRLGPADFELLELLARECSLRLRNLRLEAQLRDQLERIATQAEELRRSRQRLVTAQDEERRRIERNLHDGVQQQLVAHAIRLRHVVEQVGGEAAALVSELAAEAEDAVFALQELGRGIFPSVLVDQGLPAALRTQATRTPLSVHVEADASIAGRRLDPEHEAALYFVALEALANAQKHAPGAAVSIALRAEGDAAVLEVHDDGPGFDPQRSSAGSGRQNMADRLAAIGGELILASAPGTGTVVRAAVPAALPLSRSASASSTRSRAAT